MAGLIKKEFTSSGSWTAPSGVTRVWVRAFGGGQGGSGGWTGGFDVGRGGGAAMEALKVVDVAPNTAYTITIGGGGAGGAVANPGTAGSNTSFGSLVVAVGGNYDQVEFKPIAGIAEASAWAENTPGASGTFDPPGGVGGTGGAAGPGGNGGAGGNGSDAGTATAGTAGAANTGAGGGGGGSTDSGTAAAGAAGGSGYLEVMWVE